jgi:hypothetical protein
MNIDTTGGATIAALILLISNFVTLFTENSDLTFSTISQATWVVMIGGALIAGFKDYQALSTRRIIGKMTGTGDKTE